MKNQSGNVAMNESQRINWRAIAIASVIALIAGAIIGAAWGVIGLILFAASGDAALEAVMSPAGYIVGFIVSLIPVVIGVLYLLQSIEHDEQKHCIVFGVVNVVAYLVFALASDDATFAWHDILYYLAIIPTAMITHRITTR